MRRAFRSELVKLGRPTVLYSAGAVLPLLALLATTLLYLNAGTTASADPRAPFSITLAQLGQAGGLTRGFAGATGFLGVLVFVLFLTSVTGEHANGTLRTLLVREPRRARLLAGKLLALLGLVAVSLVAAEVLSGVLAVVLADARGIPTTDWFSAAGWSEAASDYGNAVLAATAFGASGAAVGVLVRSTAVGLAIGLAWLLPLEHIVENAWADAGRWFPGLLFDAVGAGGTAVTSYSRGLALGSVYAAALLLVGFVTFVRRDVTA